MTPEQRDLVTNFLPRLTSEARGFARRHRAAELDDCMSAGTEALVEVAMRFDPEIGTTFAAFAVPRIRGAMLDAFRWRTGRGRIVMVDAQAVGGFADSRRLYAGSAARILSVLEPELAAVVEAIDLRGVTLAEYAAAAGVAISTVARWRAKALEQLRGGPTGPRRRVTDSDFAAALGSHGPRRAAEVLGVAEATLEDFARHGGPSRKREAQRLRRAAAGIPARIAVADRLPAPAVLGALRQARSLHGAARLLGVARNTLRQRARQLGLGRDPARQLQHRDRIAGGTHAPAL